MSRFTSLPPSPRACTFGPGELDFAISRFAVFGLSAARRLHATTACTSPDIPDAPGETARDYSKLSVAIMSTSGNAGRPSASDAHQSTSISDAAIAREVNNEDRYRALLSNLLKTFSSANSNIQVEDSTLFEAERKIVQDVASSETASIAAGACIGIAAFLSMRFLPRQLIKLMGGEQKVKALNEADALASPVQKAFQLVVEASFGMWTGWAGYNKVSSMQEGSYEKIAKIPLVEGRSAFADGMCGEWMDIAYNQVPPAFWKNLNTHRSDAAAELGLADSLIPKLKDPKSFEAIQQFANNCAKRRAFEQQIRKERGLEDNTPVSIPSPGIPATISTNEAELVVSDNDKL